MERTSRFTLMQLRVEVFFFFFLNPLLSETHRPPLERSPWSSGSFCEGFFFFIFLLLGTDNFVCKRRDINKLNSWFYNMIWNEQQIQLLYYICSGKLHCYDLLCVSMSMFDKENKVLNPTQNHPHCLAAYKLKHIFIYITKHSRHSV